MKLLFLIMVSLSTGVAWAVVDVRDWSYSESWQDLPEITITRQYNLKASGSFGKSWCTWLDLQNTCFPPAKKISTNLYQVTVNSTNYNLVVDQGKVIAVSSPNSNFQITYVGNLIKKISNEKYSAEFSYQDRMLTSVRNGYQNTYKYEYQKSFLTKVVFPGNTYIELQYNPQGQVTQFKNQKKCIETYTNNNHQRIVQKICGRQETVKKIFTVKNNFVTKMVTRTPTSIEISSFDVKCKKPLSLVTNDLNRTTNIIFKYNKNCEVKDISDLVNKENLSISYYSNKTLKSITTNRETLTFQYNKNLKPEVITHSQLGSFTVTYSQATGKILEVYPTNRALSEKLSHLLDYLALTDTAP